MDLWNPFIKWAGLRCYPYEPHAHDGLTQVTQRFPFGTFELKTRTKERMDITMVSMDVRTWYIIGFSTLIWDSKVNQRLLTLRRCEMGLVSGEIFGHNRSRCFWLFFIEVEEYSEFFSRSIHKFMKSWIWAGNFSNPTGTSVVTTWNMIFSVVWCLMSLWLTFCVTFLMKKRTNIVVNDGGVHPLARTLLSLVSNLWWNIVMKDWDSDEKSFGKWQ